MIRKLMMTTAISLVAASGAMAQDDNGAATADPMMEQFLQEQGENELATNIIGHSVYTSDADDAEIVGDINDLLVADDGTIEAVVIGVGGFLGVGEKSVAVSYDSIRWAEDENGEQFAVFEASKESLQNAPEFTPEEERTALAPAEDGQEMAEEPAEGEQETAAAPTEEPAEGEQETAAAPTDEPAEGEQETAAAPTEEPVESEEMAAGEQATQPVLSDVDAGSLSAEELIGATVYATATEENVGEVGDVRLSADGGEVDALIVDVGGFLGIGEKPVAVGFENLTIQKDEAGTFYVYTDFTREELEAAPDYDEATYDEQRHSMRLTMER